MPAAMRGLEHLAGLAGVADDQNLGARGAGLARGGAPERERELGAEKLAGDAADAIGAEQASETRRAPSAWRTADACAPS